MSNIDNQAQRMRNYLNTAVISGVKLLHLTTDELSGLLDELEKEKGYASAYEAEKWHYHGLAESEGERADRAEKRAEAAESRIAELEAIKPIGYFAYDTDGGFTNHETAERAQEEAQNAIEYFRENACDGWSDEVDSVCWGAIMQEANKVDERPVTSEDKCASHIEFYCDYALLPGSNSAAGIGKGE